MTGEGILVRSCVRTKIRQVTPYIKELGSDPNQTMKLLRKKLLEEVGEAITAENPQELLEELGDIQQVIYDMAKCAGWAPYNVHNACDDKTDRKGDFSVVLAWKQPEE